MLRQKCRELFEKMACLVLHRHSFDLAALERDRNLDDFASAVLLDFTNSHGCKKANPLNRRSKITKITDYFF